MVNKKCIICNKLFHPTGRNHISCSSKCLNIRLKEIRDKPNQQRKI